MLRAAGIVALIVFAACTQTNPPAVASPSPVIPQGNWTQNLTFTGAIYGTDDGDRARLRGPGQRMHGFEDAHR